MGLAEANRNVFYNAFPKNETSGMQASQVYPPLPRESFRGVII